MRLAELYQSVQGEGLLTGTPSVFVRASGCNLRCGFCDTPFASWEPEGTDVAPEEIVARVLAYDCDHVVLTGGEPMLFADSVPLTTRLRKADRHITIETAGTRYLPVACDLMSISPKLANSTPEASRAGRWRARHERDRHAPEVVRRLMAEYPYQLKFVVDSPEDIAEVQQYLSAFPSVDRSRVLLMPQGTDAESLADKAQWLEPLCRQHGFRFCPRQHIAWYGFARGT